MMEVMTFGQLDALLRELRSRNPALMLTVATDISGVTLHAVVSAPGRKSGSAIAVKFGDVVNQAIEDFIAKGG